MKWNGRSYRPANAQIINNKKPFDFQEALKPYGEKEIPVWSVVMNVEKEPSTPTPTPTPLPTCIWNETTSSWQSTTMQWDVCP